MNTLALATSTQSLPRWNSESAPRFQPNYPIVLLRPPYDEGDLRAALPDLNGSATVLGTIVGVQITRPQIDPATLQTLVQELGRRMPGCPVAVFLKLVPEEAVAVATRLTPLRLRSVVSVGPDMRNVLRETLTDTTTLGHDVVDWFQLHHSRLNPNQADLLEKIIAAALEHGDLTTLLEHFGIPQSTARSRLRKRRLPSPNRWFQAARAVHAALRLQSHPELSLSRAAWQLGFADHSALAHLLRRSFRITANEVRGTLGWECLLERWLSFRRAPRR